MQTLTPGMINRFLWNLKEREVELRSLCLYQDGNMLLKKAYAPFSEDSLHPVYSVSKSFLSVLIGWLLEEKKLKLSDPWILYFPEYQSYAGSPAFWTVTIRDLLTMTLGQKREASVQKGDDWIRKIVEEPVVIKPGTQFFYNSQASFLLGVLVERVSGKSYQAYLEEKILAPLGISVYECETNQAGQAIAGLCLHLRTEDVAKFGIALLEGGQYQGRQIVPRFWVSEVGKKQVENKDVIAPEKVEDCQGYGYQFWLCSQGGYRCSGLYGQLCYIWPEKHLVLAANSAASGNGEILSCLYDAIRENPSEEPDFQEFGIPPVKGEPALRFGKCWRLNGTWVPKPNDFGIELLELSVDEGEKFGCQIGITRRGIRYAFDAAYGRWLLQEDRFTPFTPYLYKGAMDPVYHEEFLSRKLYGSCAWKDSDTLIVQLRAENYSGVLEFVFRFFEKDMVEMDYRVSAYLTEENALSVKFAFTGKEQ